MGLSNFLVAPFGPVLTLIMGLILWLRYWPLALRGSDILASSDREFLDPKKQDSSLEKIGELITSLMLAKDGWTQSHLPASNTLGPRKIFVRERFGLNRYEVRFVETNCTRTVADSGANLIGQTGYQRFSTGAGALELDNCHSADDGFARTITRAVRWHSARVEKLLYAHCLATGTTRIYKVAPDGRPLRAIAVIATRSHKGMCRALTIGLSASAFAAFPGTKTAVPTEPVRAIRLDSA